MSYVTFTSLSWFQYHFCPQVACVTVTTIPPFYSQDNWDDEDEEKKAALKKKGTDMFFISVSGERNALHVNEQSGLPLLQIHMFSYLII